MHCPGSINLGRDIPNPPSGPHAKEGSCAHRVGELCLLSGQDAVSAVGEIYEDVEVTEEMCEAVQVYLDAVRTDQALLGGELFVETGFNLESLHPGLYGTNDAALLAGDTLLIYDYKHGRGHVVEVEANPQLMYYGLGAVIRLQQSGKPTPSTVELVIVQPRAGHPRGPVRRWSIDLIDLIGWAGELLNAVRRTLDPEAPIVAGDWCLWCKASSRCPKQLEQAQSVARMDFQSVVDVPPNPVHLNLDQLLQIVAKADQVENWLQECRLAVERMLEAGQHVPGWKLVKKRASRRWKVGDAEVVCALIGLNVEKRELYSDPELKSVAQIEKLVPAKARKGLAALYESVSSGHVMAPENDPRAAILPPAMQDFAAFAKAEPQVKL